VVPAAAALERARELAGPQGNVLVCGSLYLVGEILALSG
jgi:folylpolyglutamate synthase/dihydropteroate synthase